LKVNRPWVTIDACDRAVGLLARRWFPWGDHRLRARRVAMPRWTFP